MNIKEGDMVWVSIKGASQKYGYGEVDKIFTSKRGICFEFVCLVNGGRQLGLEANIIDKPTARMVAKLSSAIRDVNEVLKNKR